tara:strand:- start:655 stop:990 length:336 start_codon:yes stop_codon:yes gene_type:complete
MDVSNVVSGGEGEVEVEMGEEGDVEVRITFLTASTKCRLTFVYDGGVEGMVRGLPGKVEFDIVLGSLMDTKEFVQMAAEEELEVWKGKAMKGGGGAVIEKTFTAVGKMLNL